MVHPNQPPTLRVASDIRDPQGLAFFSVGSSAISPARFRSQRHRACVTRVSFTTRETGWRRPARFPACSGQSSDHPSPPPAARQALCGEVDAAPAPGPAAFGPAGLVSHVAASRECCGSL